MIGLTSLINSLLHFLLEGCLVHNPPLKPSYNGCSRHSTKSTSISLIYIHTEWSISMQSALNACQFGHFQRFHSLIHRVIHRYLGMRLFTFGGDCDGGPDGLGIHQEANRTGFGLGNLRDNDHPVRSQDHSGIQQGCGGFLHTKPCTPRAVRKASENHVAF